MLFHRSAEQVLPGERTRASNGERRKPRLVRLGVPLAVLLAAFAGLGFSVAPHYGWATPFSLSPSFTYRGLAYFRQDCVNRLPKSQQWPRLPARRIGSIFGYFTSSKPILLPSRPGYATGQPPHPVNLLVRDGSCLRDYMETADLG
jgi:hypothetical protein